MNIKTRLIVLFLIMAIIPLVLVSYLEFVSDRDVIFKKTIEQLISVAEIQKQRVNEKIGFFIQQAKLVTSRTQLRVSLDSFQESGDPEVQRRMTNIILDAAISTPVVVNISVLNILGKVVASTDQMDLGKDYSREQFFTDGQNTHIIYDVFNDENNILNLALTGPFVLDGKTIGVAKIIVNADALIALTEDYSGLGDTGELILSKKNEVGDAVFLTPLRFDAGAALRRAIPKEKTNVPMIIALSGQETVLIAQETIDYRGERVLAVTRYIEALGWGLVAKIDREEALEPQRLLLKSIASILSLSIILIIIISYIVVKALVRPIKSLTLFAQNLEKGNFKLRTEVMGHDEIGILARAFNNTTAKLQELYESMEDKIKQRTKQLQDAKTQDEAILENIGDGLIVTNKERQILLVNKAAQEMVGLDEAMILDKKWPDVLGHQNKGLDVVDETSKAVAREKLPIYRALRQGKNIENSDYFYLRTDGTRFAVAITASALVSKGKVTGSIVVFRDITKAKQIDKAKTEFVSLASHQLRTPLSTINWYTEMLLSGDAGNLTPEQKKYLSEIYHGNQRMVDLVNALLNVSRLELGTFVIEPELIDVIELTQSVIKEQKPQADAKKQNIKTEFTIGIPKIQADPKLLRMVFQNLLSNAIKYTPEGGTLSIRIEFKDKQIMISVSDTGWGIPKNQQDQIFSKLFRADNVRAQDTEGTGLGLYIVKSIIEHSGGKITFQSEENKGTTFIITLPINGMQKKEGSRSLA